jgi:hypothetical protein
MALISGTLVGFLASVTWLPGAPLQFPSPTDVLLGIIGGLLILLLASVLLALLPHQPAAVYAEGALLWVVALWAYPQALQRLWLGRRTVVTQSE